MLLVEICLGLSDIHHCDNALGGGGDQHVVSSIHTVDTLGADLFSNVVGGPEIPVLDRLVPGSRNEHGLAVDLDTSDCPYRLLVLCDLSCLLCVEVHESSLVVGAARDYVDTVLRENVSLSQ